MEEFLSRIIKILKGLGIKPVIYGSFGASTYIGIFKTFEDTDILIKDEFMNGRWEEFKRFLIFAGFNLVDEKEHEFEFEGKKIGFASEGILIRDKIITDFSELIQYKNMDAFTLTPEDFLKAYRFSEKDGYRINERGKKDKDIIEKLETYIKKNKNRPGAFVNNN